MIAILDFSLGNLRSIYNGFHFLGYESIITREKKVIREARAIVLPGVGAFKDGMENLIRFDLIESIWDAVQNEKPLLGICLGLQLLFSESEEFGLHKGIGIFRGKIISFKGPFKIPHMGWNNLQIIKSIPLLEGIRNNEFFYFVHSFYAHTDEKGIIAAKTEYGTSFPSVIQKGNIMATQFHPEKSSHPGLLILKNFAALTSKIRS